MSDRRATAEALRAALAVSPDNTPLRHHLAQVLTAMEAWTEAAGHWRWLWEHLPGGDPARAEAALQAATCLRAARQLGGEDGAGAWLRRAVDATVAGGGSTVPLRVEVLLTLARWAAAEVPGVERQEGRDAYLAAVALRPEAANRRLAAALGAVIDDVVVRLVPRAEQAAVGRERITFADVGGMEPLKEEVRRRIIAPLQQPELHRAYGRRPGGGLLLFGPPGCGKTMLMRAAAGESGARFLPVGLHQVLSMWVGDAEKSLHDLFAEARRSTPSILFLDEADALGTSRQATADAHVRRWVSQLLMEMDGAVGDNAGVLVAGATNRPWNLDPALRRPGRFDRTLFVPPPDRAARRSILEIALRGRPCAPDLDLEGVAERTEGWSGADLAALADRAADGAMDEAAARGAVVAITQPHLEAGLADTRPSTAEWFGLARRYAKYADEAGTYTAMLEYLAAVEAPRVRRARGWPRRRDR